MNAADRHEQPRRLSESYWKAPKRERTLVLNAYCVATGLSRKHAIGLLRNPRERASGPRRGAGPDPIW